MGGSFGHTFPARLKYKGATNSPWSLPWKINIPIPKIKVLSIVHYSSSAEAASAVALCTTQVTMASIGLVLCSPLSTPVT